jgi:hypothetical protein
MSFGGNMYAGMAWPSKSFSKLFLTPICNFFRQVSPEVAGPPLWLDLGHVVVVLKAAFVVAFLVESGWVFEFLEFDRCCSGVSVLEGSAMR